MSQSVDFHLSLYNLCNPRNLWICVLLSPIFKHTKAKTLECSLSSELIIFQLASSILDPGGQKGFRVAENRLNATTGAYGA